MKYLSDDVKSNPTLFQRGVIDLTIETQILSVVSHPNIIKLRGSNKHGLLEPSYFIVLDRLYSTLHDKMEEWGKKTGKLHGLVKRVKNKKSLKEKLGIAYNIACALAYLHTLRIVHRDVKPDNIGFDHKGELKLFDFGLACELRKEYRDGNGLYQMTGNTGSRRYMAPEVAREEAYNHTVDIYSLGILLWEIMEEKKAFDGYSLETHDIMVAQVGERPEINENWPEPVSQLIEKCWAHNCRKRPQSDVLCITIKTLMDTV